MNHSNFLLGTTAAQNQQLDQSCIRNFGIPSILLMEHASLGVAEFIQQLHTEYAAPAASSPNSICILVGPGNNGGDGYAIARHLYNANIAVQVLELQCPPAAPATGQQASDPYCQRQMLKHLPIQISAYKGEELPASWLYVDALFGTGLARAPEGKYFEAIEKLNSHIAENNQSRALAVDIPSGLCSDSGKAIGISVNANWTLTFAMLKIGFSKPEAARYLGELYCVPIGAPRSILPAGAPAFPPRAHPITSH